MYARISGTGSYLPRKELSNKDLEQIVATNDEWIVSRTGIRKRHVVEGEQTSDLALYASRSALADAGIPAEALDLIIVATITPNTVMPSVACVIQKKLGAKYATAFDITAACSGLIYGMDIANQYIQTGRAQNVLVVGAEAMSQALDWTDRNTCVLFGDGAGAVVLSADDKRGIKGIYTGSDGDLDNYLTLNSQIHEKEASPYIHMEGQEIFKFAVRIIRKSLQYLIDNEGLLLNRVKYIIPHQANYRIIEAVAQKMNIPVEKFFMNLDQVGNTSSASIGIALDEMRRKDLIQAGDCIVCIGFGGGLTWGAMTIEL